MIKLTMFEFPNTRKPDFRAIRELDYNTYWRERGCVLNQRLKEREQIILDLIPVGARVIDIGCGNSLLPVALMEKGCLVSVADVSDEVLEVFSKYKITGFHFDLQSLSRGIITEHYDYIILSEVLEHTANPEAILMFLRPLADNFIITIPNSAFYRYRWHLMFGGRFFTQWVYHPSEHLRFWSHIDFLDWLEAVGLKVEKVLSSNGFSFFGLLPQLKNWWPNLFGHQIVYVCSVRK